MTGDPNTAVSVPTPTEAEMINPGYEDYVVTATRQDGTETTTTALQYMIYCVIMMTIRLHLWLGRK